MKEATLPGVHQLGRFLVMLSSQIEKTFINRYLFELTEISGRIRVIVSLSRDHASFWLRIRRTDVNVGGVDANSGRCRGRGTRSAKRPGSSLAAGICRSTCRATTATKLPEIYSLFFLILPVSAAAIRHIWLRVDLFRLPSARALTNSEFCIAKEDVYLSGSHRGFASQAIASATPST